ncbi:MAG TPA: sugar transferase [Actinomycetota bacterium]|nr:sugar transferase [Actinomycetota bacterium]
MVVKTAEARIQKVEDLAPLRIPTATPSSRSGGSFHARMRTLSLWMAGSDAFCVLLALVASYITFFGIAAMPASWLWMVVTAPLVWCGVFYGFRLYSHHLSSWEELRALISASTVGIFVVMMVSFWSRSSFSRAWIGMTWVLVIGFELASRKLWRRHLTRKKASGSLACRTLVIGANDEAGRITETLSAPHLGFDLLGYVTPDGLEGTANHIPVLGGMADLDELISLHSADCLFVATSAIHPEQMLTVARVARQAGIEVKVSANLPEMLTSRLTVQPMGSLMSLSLRPVKLTRLQSFLKRAFDLAVASSLLLVSSPIWLLLAAAIKLTSRGPVLFRQRRGTQGGKFFSILKFRTMVEDGDRLLRERGIDSSIAFFKVENDPRVTRVGRFIRKWSLDELPQLINVVRGQMSLVGPRPLPEDQIAANPDLLAPRLEVPAGVTGWWQVNGRSEVSAEDAVRMDLFYIENWSLSLDLYILAKTFAALVMRRGAF